MTEKLKMDHFQPGDVAIVARVAGANGVTKLKRTSSDPQIAQGKVDAFICLFATDPRDDCSGGYGKWTDRNCRFQIVQKRTFAMSTLESRPNPRMADSMAGAGF
jgi:hypothetical protein